MVQNHGGMQMEPIYLSIQPVETGKRIKQLLSEQNYTIREIQGAFGFENPQAIYKWIAGKSLPSLDNFIILSRLLHTSIENIHKVIDDFFKQCVNNIIIMRNFFCDKQILFNKRLNALIDHINSCRRHTLNML